RQEKFEYRTVRKASTGKVSQCDKPRLGGNALTPRSWLVLEKLPLLLLSGASSIITIKASQRAGDLRSLEELGVYNRISNAFVSYVEYPGELVWPVNLAVFYPPREAHSIAMVSLAFLIVVGISVGVLYEARHFPYLFAGWFWFLVTLFPVIGIVQAGSQAMADRYAYLPMIGPFVVVAWGVATLGEYLRLSNSWLALLGTSALIAFGVGTAFQLRYWQNSDTLFRHALQVTNRNNYIAHGHLGIVSLSQGRVDEGIQHLTEAMETNPGRDSFERRI